MDIPPHEEKEIRLNFSVPEKGKCFLKMTYLLKAEVPLLEQGCVLGFEEVAIETYLLRL